METLSPLFVGYRAEEFGFYGQDSWRVSSKLRLNYGIRLDVVPMLREAHDRVSCFDPNELNPAAGGILGALSFFGTGPGRNGQKAIANLQHPLAPQFGFAYSLRPKTVIRGSYGNSSVSLFGSWAGGLNLSGGGGSYGFNWDGSFQNQRSGIASAPFIWDNGFPLTVPSLPNLDPSLENGAFLPTWDRKGLKGGRSQNINFGIEQELPNSVLLKVAYVGNLSHGVPTGDLIDPSQLNPKYLSLGSPLSQDVYSPAAQAAGISVPFPGFVGSVGLALKPYAQYIGVANTQANVGFSLYNSLQVSAQKRYGDLSFLARYTISKQLDNYGAFGGNGEGFTFLTIQNTAYWHNYKVLANNDRPQTLVMSWVYHLPFGPGKRYASSTNPVVKQLVGGWRVAGIQTYESGGVLTVGSIVTIPSVNVGGGFGPIWPLRVPGVPITKTTCGSYVPGNPGSNQYLNNAALADAAPFTLGNTNVLPNLRGCGYYDEDISLQKEFKIKERVGLLLSGDANNIFNRHAWTGLNTNIDSPGLGQFNGATGPRLIQVHARLSFLAGFADPVGTFTWVHVKKVTKLVMQLWV